MMRAPVLLATLIALAVAAPAAGQGDQSLPTGPFRAVELHGGGTVTIRHAAVHGLTLREGDLRVSRVALVGDRLVVERCRDHCPRGYRLAFEVGAPQIDALTVSNGGHLFAAGGFPGQPALAARVDNGGILDIRALAAEQVNASVRQGGGILTRPGRTLEASVSNGGIVTYWGEPRVRSAVRQGGAVTRGALADANRPLPQLQQPPPPLAPIPPVPPVPLLQRD